MVEITRHQTEVGQDLLLVDGQDEMISQTSASIMPVYCNASASVISPESYGLGRPNRTCREQESTSLLHTC